MLFGGLDGFTSFDPTEIKLNNVVPLLAFTDLHINGEVVDPKSSGILNKSINHTSRLTFSHGTANFSIGMVALDYLSPQSNHLQYKLEGIDGEWNNSRGKAEATYTIQREGSYLLRMRGANNDGLWNPVERTILIEVLPPVWRTWYAYLIYGFVCILSVVGIWLFINLRHSYQLEHLARQRDEELHEGKLRFFTNITHEFRTPLTLIVGPLQDMLASDQLSPAMRTQITGIQRNSQKLLDLVDRVLTFRKLSTVHGTLKGEKGDLHLFLRKLAEPFIMEAERRSIEFELKAEAGELWTWYDPRKLEMAITALLNNAMKFTPDGGRIQLRVVERDVERVEIRVSDSGCGVDESLREQVFQRFYEDRSAAQVPGTGIGLSLAKDLLALHNGSIHIEDSEFGGAAFVINIPRGAENFATQANPADEQEAARLLPASSSKSAEDPLFVESNSTDESVAKPSTILIIEDNSELREYLRSIFVSRYSVVLAEDGYAGLQLVRSDQTIDLILSDVMMPHMDGLELCNLVKTDLAPSHIPVILLTARNGTHARMEGWENGADAYIPKPFQPRELLLQVGNLLSTRRRIRESFKRVIKLEPEEIAVTSADEEFLVKLLHFVEENMADETLTVNHLADAANVSRALLFIKLKALTDQTPGGFLKGLRMKRAAQLLASDKLNVSEVAYRVGFRDPKYFSKCFKEEYGVSAASFKQGEQELAS